MSAPEPGLVVTHRRYVSYAEAHYAGNLVDGAYGLGLFGDVATEMCVRTDGDEGLLASYSEVQFRSPVHGGDLVDARAELVGVGNRSRALELTLLVVGRADPDGADSAARMLPEPLVATTARGVVIVPVRRVDDDTPRR